VIPEPFMRAAVEAIAFVGMCRDDVVQPDAAVSQLELLAFVLKGLNEIEKEHFRQFVRNLAAEEEASAGRTERIEFLLTLTENLGLS
jgi:hypothetical protein